MPREATGSAVLHKGTLYAIVTLPKLPGEKTPKRPWLPVPNHIKTLDQAREYAGWYSQQVRLGNIPRPNLAAPTEAKPVPPEPEGESLKAWSERWIKARRAAKIASVDDDEGRLKNHVWPTLGAKPMTAITSADLEDVRDALDRQVRENKMAWKNAVNIWGVVTNAFKVATSGKDRSLRVLAVNPAVGLLGPDRGSGQAKQYLYPSEAIRLLSAPSTPEHWALMFALAIYSGLRAGELEALLWEDVDLEHGILSVTKAVSRKTGLVESTKSGETRLVPIEPALRPLLEALRRDGFDRTKRVTWMALDETRASGLRKYLERAHVTRAGLLEDTPTTRAITYHDLRGTYLTWSAIRGDSPLVIQQRAGHSDFVTTQGYIREAENLRAGFGETFPPIPDRLLRLRSAPRAPLPPKLPSPPGIVGDNRWSA